MNTKRDFNINVAGVKWGKAVQVAPQGEERSPVKCCIVFNSMSEVTMNCKMLGSVPCVLGKYIYFTKFYQEVTCIIIINIPVSCMV